MWTIIVAIIVFGLIGADVAYLIYKRKNHKGGCCGGSGDCSGNCGSCGGCH